MDLLSDSRVITIAIIIVLLVIISISNYLKNKFFPDNNSDTLKIISDEIFRLKQKYRTPLIDSFYKEINSLISNKPNIIFETIEKYKIKTPKAWIYSPISNKIGDLLETGKYHVYRGILDTEGQTLLKIYCDMMDLLVDCEEVTEEDASSNIHVLKVNISRIG